MKISIDFSNFCSVSFEAKVCRGIVIEGKVTSYSSGKKKGPFEDDLNSISHEMNNFWLEKEGMVHNDGLDIKWDCVKYLKQFDDDNGTMMSYLANSFKSYRVHDVKWKIIVSKDYALNAIKHVAINDVFYVVKDGEIQKRFMSTRPHEWAEMVQTMAKFQKKRRKQRNDD